MSEHIFSDSDALSQIQDIIVNQYEEGFSYDMGQLQEILDAIVEVLDGRDAGRKKQQEQAREYERNQYKSDPVRGLLKERED